MVLVKETHTTQASSDLNFSLLLQIFVTIDFAARVAFLNNVEGGRRALSAVAHHASEGLSVERARQTAGATPNSRLNARLKGGLRVVAGFEPDFCDGLV